MIAWKVIQYQLSTKFKSAVTSPNDDTKPNVLTGFFYQQLRRDSKEQGQTLADTMSKIRRSLKTFEMLLLIVGIFFFFWCPYFLFDILRPTAKYAHLYVHKPLLVSGLCQSGANVLVYVHFDRTYSNILHQWLGKRMPFKGNVSGY
jgi:hypothetical protein